MVHYIRASDFRIPGRILDFQNSILLYWFSSVPILQYAILEHQIFEFRIEFWIFRIPYTIILIF